MVKGCTNSCIKFILFFFNFLFVVVGLTIFGCGIYLLVKSSNIKEIISTPDHGAILIIVSGFLVFLVSFLGCCGSVQESRCMLNTYGVIVGLLSLLQIAAAIFFLIYSTKLTDIATDETKKAMDNYVEWGRNNDPKKDSVDMLQWTLGCCGYKNGPEDWGKTMPPFPGFPKVPNSCCFDPKIGTNNNQYCQIGGMAAPFTKGCAPAIEDTFRVYIGVISGFTIGISVIQLIAACFACMLGNAVY